MAMRLRISRLALCSAILIGTATMMTAVQDRGLQSAPDRSAEPSAANYWALIIGINRYGEWPALETAVNDARELQSLLQTQYGFFPEHIRLRLDADATLVRLNRDLREMAQQMQP